MNRRARHTGLPPGTPSPILLFGTCLLLLFAAAGCGKKPVLPLREYQMRTEEARRLLSDGHAAKALEIARELTAQPREDGRDSVIAEAYTLAALSEERLGRYEDALADFKTAMKHIRDAMDQGLERQNKFALARFYFASGEYVVARRLASEAAAAARVFADSGIYAGALLLAADANGRSGEPGRALEALRDLEQARGGQTPDLLRLRFDILRRAGRDADVRDFLAAAAGASRAASDRRGAMTAAYLGGLYQESLGHADSALAFYSAALTNLDASSDASFAPELMTSLGNVAYRLRHFADARRYYGDALERIGASGDGLFEPMLALAAAACDWKAARQGTAAEEAAGRFAAVLKTCRQSGNARAEALAQFLLGAAAEQRGDPAAAGAFYRDALAAAESHPSRFFDLTPAGRLTDALLDGEQSGWFAAPARLAASAGDARAAFEAAERGTLDDIGSFFLESSLDAPDVATRDAADAVRWRRHLAARCEHDIEDELAAGKSASQERLTALRDAARSLASAADSAARLVAAAAPNFRWVLTERAVNVRAVQDTMPEGSALLEYIVAPKRLTILVLRKDTILARPVEIDRSRLLGMVGEYNRLLGDARVNADGTPAQQPGAVRRMRDLASMLSGILMDPVAQAVRGSGPLYIVPPAEFDWLPFHTLRVDRGEAGSSALLEERVVKYLPAAAMLLCAPVADRPVRTVEGFGHPGTTNWDVEYELSDIRSYYDKAPMAFDTAATLRRLTRLGADVVHLAVDVTLFPEEPGRSIITVSGGTTPYARAHAPLGALAAVPPAPTMIVSDIAPAPGGLRRYAPAMLLAAGNRTLIATMWRGDRRAQRYFGEIFYTTLSTGLPSGEAYRAAMLAMIKKGEFSPEQRWGLYFQFGR